MKCVREQQDQGCYPREGNPVAEWDPSMAGRGPTSHRTWVGKQDQEQVATSNQESTS